MGITVKDLLVRWPWRPIRHCPGRYVLANKERRLTLPMLLGRETQPETFVSASAKDPVQVTWLADGGIISYLRPDGTLVHTLNTAEGFARKLRQLGIAESATGAFTSQKDSPDSA